MNMGKLDQIDLESISIFPSKCLKHSNQNTQKSKLQFLLMVKNALLNQICACGGAMEPQTSYMKPSRYRFLVLDPSH